MTGGLVEPVTARLPREPVFRKFHSLDSPLPSTKVLAGSIRMIIVVVTMMKMIAMMTLLEIVIMITMITMITNCGGINDNSCGITMMEMITMTDVKALFPFFKVLPLTKDLIG